MKNFYFTVVILFGVTVLQAQKHFQDKQGVGIGIGAFDLINKGSQLDYFGISYMNQYTKYYKKVHIDVRLNFMNSVRIFAIQVDDNFLAEKWRIYSAQSIEIPINYYLLLKKRGAISVGTGGTIRHRASAIPEIALDSVIINHEHYIDLGFVFQFNTLIFLNKNLTWRTSLYYTKYDGGHPIFGMNNFVTYQF